MERPYLDYGLSDFTNKRSHILFVTGYMGSGKSTIAKQIAGQNNAIALGLDYVFEWNATANTFASDSEQNAFFYLLEKGKLWTRISGNIGTYSDKWTAMSASQRALTIIELAIKHCDASHRYIVEGIHLYVYPEMFEKIIDHPIIIMNLTTKQAQISDFQRARNRGEKLLPLLLNRGSKSKYYTTQEKLFNAFIAKVKVAKEEKSLKSAVLEMMIIPGIDLGVIPGMIPTDGNSPDIAQEGIFTPGNAQAETLDWGLVNAYGIKAKNTGYYFIGDKYIQNIMQTWVMCPGEFPKKGITLLATMLKELEAMHKFAEENQDKLSEYHDKRNPDAAQDLFQQQMKLAPTLTACGNLAQQNKAIFSGAPTPVTTPVKTKCTTMLQSVSKIMNVAAHKAEGSWVDFHNASVVNKLFNKTRLEADASAHSALWSRLHFYCRIFIMSFESAVLN